jgi:hypothetical protein
MMRRFRSRVHYRKIEVFRKSGNREKKSKSCSAVKNPVEKNPRVLKSLENPGLKILPDSQRL